MPVILPSSCHMLSSSPPPPFGPFPGAEAHPRATGHAFGVLRRCSPHHSSLCRPAVGDLGEGPLDVAPHTESPSQRRNRCATKSMFGRSAISKWRHGPRRATAPVSPSPTQGSPEALHPRAIGSSKRAQGKGGPSPPWCMVTAGAPPAPVPDAAKARPERGDCAAMGAEAWRGSGHGGRGREATATWTDRAEWQRGAGRGDLVFRGSGESGTQHLPATF